MAISDDLIYTTIPRDPPDPSLSASGDCLLNQSCFLDGVDEPGAFFLESFEKPRFPKMEDFLENFQTAFNSPPPTVGQDVDELIFQSERKMRQNCSP